MEKNKKKLLIISGALIGLINGIFGGGGGMIAVPLMVKFLGYDNKTAHATAIAVILPVSLFTAIVYLFSGAFSVSIGLWTTAGVVGGGVVGAILLKKLNASSVGKIFALVMLLSGIKLLFW